MDYRVDLRDLKFQLFEWLEIDRVFGVGRFTEWESEQVEMVIDEALRLAREQFAECNDDGDRQVPDRDPPTSGARSEERSVLTEMEFKHASPIQRFELRDILPRVQIKQRDLIIIQ